VEDLGSIFADEDPIEYLLEPELPKASIVTLAGTAESGKSTLACAWARDLYAKGHPVLYLDGDKNPRAVIRDRLERLGVHADGPLFRIWDYKQPGQAVPMPDDPRVVDWLKRMMEATKLPALCIVDSLIAFLPPDGSENDSLCMRQFFNRCRVLTNLGATVNPLHHTGKSETSKDGRGASDYAAASDQAFLVSNYNPDGSRLLHTIKLQCRKSRFGLQVDLVYSYQNGKMFREQDRNAMSKTESDQLTAILRQHRKGISQTAFERLAVLAGLARQNARIFLTRGRQCGEIRFDRNLRGSGGLYFLSIPDESPDEDQEDLPLPPENGSIK
jgi:hypothetical protein